MKINMTCKCTLISFQAGNFGRSGRNFSQPHKCAIYSKLLPNRKTEVARHSSKLFCGSFSTSGDIFMSACQDSMIRLYDAAGGRFRLMKGVQARNVGWSVLDVALSPDSRHLIYTSWCDYSECILCKINLIKMQRYSVYTTKMR